jgi:NitT/TauT family transport system substrate-binding protein
VKINAQAISKLKYIPAVAKCRKDILAAAKEMKTAGLLKDSTDPEKLAERAWLDLEGVNDKWVNSLEVEKIAGAGPPRRLTPVEFAALFEANKDCTCCCRCCIDR